MKLEYRDDLGSFLTYHGLTGKGVEVGTFKGEFAKTILSKWNGVLYMVDPWREELGSEYTNGDYPEFKNKLYFQTIENTKEYQDRSFMLRGFSNQLIDLFEDESLDFVYIDANHAYDFVIEDIELWFPKVKKGGVVSGHDYILFGGSKEGWYQDPNWAENKKDKHMWDGSFTHYNGLFGVNTAVDEFAKKNNYQVSHTKEFSSSWFFFK